MTSPINPNTVGNKTAQRFRFWIISKNGSELLTSAPTGWNGSSIVMGRGLGIGSIFTGGVISEYKVGSLKFINDGFKILYGTYNGNGEWENGLFLEDELTAKAKLLVEYLDKDFEYRSFGELFEFDFATLKTNKGKSGAIDSVSINVNQTGLFVLWQKRKNIKIDLTRTESIGGYKIIDFVDLKKIINIPEISNNFFANWENGETGNTPINPIYGPHENQIYIPKQTLAQSDFEETQSVINRGIYPDNPFGFPKKITVDDCIIKKSKFKRTLIFNQTSSFGIALKSTTRSLGGTLYIAILDTDDVTIVNETEISAFSFKNPSQTSYKAINDLEIDVLEGQSVVFYVSNFPSVGSVRTFAVRMGVVEKVVNISAKTIESMPIIQAMKRCSQLLFDKQDPFKSDFFNEIDQETFMNIMGGLHLRGLALDNRNAPITVKADEFYKSISILNNVGFGLEVIDGDEKLVVENIDYFFPDEVGLDLSDRVNPNEIEEEVFLDGIFSEFEVGFDEFSYESINGRAEYNTKNTRTSILPVGNKLELISKLRGDPKGMFVQLENPVVGEGANASEDVDGDEDAFVLKTQKDGATEWKPEVFENYTVLDNSSLFGNSSWNLFITPTNIFLRNKERIATGLNVAQNSVLAYQQSGKLSTLKTKKTGGLTEVTENQDIKVITQVITEPQIGLPKFDIRLLTVTVPFYDEDYSTLLANKNKLVKLSRNIAGWLITKEGFKYDIFKNEATFKLIKKYNFEG